MPKKEAFGSVRFSSVLRCNCCVDFFRRAARPVFIESWNPSQPFLLLSVRRPVRTRRLYSMYW